MKEETIKRWKSMVKYLRELSIVIAGIAITFTASAWISNRNERKDMNRYLSAVRMELEANLETVKEKGEFYEWSAKFGQYLRSHKPEEWHSDSLSKYSNVPSYIFYVSYKTSAFEMLKASGAMRLIKNKQLLNAILDTYSQLEENKSASDMYTNRKLDEMFRVALDNNAMDKDIGGPEMRRLYKFLSIHIDLDGVFQESKDQIQETLSLFPKGI